MDLTTNVDITRLVTASSTNATLCRNGPGHLRGIVASNTNAAAVHVKFYNIAAAASVVVGTSTIVFSFPLPGSTALGGIVCMFPGRGLWFSTGICFATVTGAADNSTGAVTAAEQIIHILTSV